MSYLDGDIEIGKNCIRYFDEILKISNISRTYIFRFINREKKAYEAEKARFELKQKALKHKRIKYWLIAMTVSLLIATNFLTMRKVIGVVVLVLAGICGYFAYRASQMNLEYQEEEYHPDKYGLNIVMNSGQAIAFTAVGEQGLRSLRKLQNDINDADTQQGITIFSMSDNRISVENNEGIISTGDAADNHVE